jgi:hypothetical protein
MTTRTQTLSTVLGMSTLVAMGALVAACSSSSGGGGNGQGPPSCDAGGSGGGTAQEPPTTSACDIEAWLAQGDYKSWTCQMSSSPGTGLSPHGAHRVCSNTALGTATGTGAYPVGASNVKEVYDSVGGKIIGYAVELKVSSGASGSDWFWYERIGSSAPIGDGDGASNCVGCHVNAGTDAGPGHDYVFTQVP